MDNESKFLPGDKVMANGHPGRIIRYYSEGMVEVRLQSGDICTDESEVIKVEDCRKFQNGDKVTVNDLDGVVCGYKPEHYDRMVKVSLSRGVIWTPEYKCRRAE